MTLKKGEKVDNVEGREGELFLEDIIEYSIPSWKELGNFFHFEVFKGIKYAD